LLLRRVPRYPVIKGFRTGIFFGGYMKNTFILLSVLLGTSQLALATQSTIVTGHGADGCALVKLDNVASNPASFRNRCYCHDMAVDRIILAKSVDCSLYCVGSANGAGEAFSCNAVASLPKKKSGGTASYKKKTTVKKSDGQAGNASGNDAADPGLKEQPKVETPIVQTPPAPKQINDSDIPEGAVVNVDANGNKTYSYVKGKTDVQKKEEAPVYEGVNSDYVKTYKNELYGKSDEANKNIADMQNRIANKGAAENPTAAQKDYNALASGATPAPSSAPVQAPKVGANRDDNPNEYSRAEKKADKKELKAAEKAAKGTNEQNAILEKNGGGYGGLYGGAKVETTQTINMGVKTLSGIASQVATNSATAQNSGVLNNVQQQGSAATQKAINNSQADMLENSAKANKTLGMGTVIMSALQGTRIASHVNSKRKVTDTYSAATKRADDAYDKAGQEYVDKSNACRARYAGTTTVPGNAAFLSTCLKEQQDRWAAADKLHASQIQNANENKSGEVDAQGNAAFNQAIETGTTAAQAALMLKQAASLKKAADAIRNQAVADTGSGFAFNPGAVQANPTPDLSAVTADPSTVVADDTVLPTDQAGTDLLNPNISDPGPGGPAAGQFTSASPSNGGAGGAAGLGSVGGTSAAKDDAKPETAAMTKGATGSYSAGEGAGSKFSRGSGGSGGVGLDSGFADLLKKFLPGGEEEKKQDDNLAFDSDRSPASDQAAVLGRNQNIFEAIHKRYQKKHTEGAIVFTGDQG
jgi:hypothetical protein